MCGLVRFGRGLLKTMYKYAEGFKVRFDDERRGLIDRLHSWGGFIVRGRDGSVVTRGV